MCTAKDRRTIPDAYPVGTSCPYCRISKLRYDLIFEVTTIKKGQVIDSSYSVKNVCAHCFTVCGQEPKMDFLCAKCRQLTPYIEEDFGSELKMFQRLFSKDGEFDDFYRRLISEGLTEGKRYCLPCVYKIWHEYLTNPDSLREELDKPKTEFPLKKF
jgi:hypothetical protein